MSEDASGAFERRAPERQAYVAVVRLLFLTGVRRNMVMGMLRPELEGLDGDMP
jgi:hypothetical protein